MGQRITTQLWTRETQPHPQPQSQQPLPRHRLKPPVFTKVRRHLDNVEQCNSPGATRQALRLMNDYGEYFLRTNKDKAIKVASWIQEDEAHNYSQLNRVLFEMGVITKNENDGIVEW